jgi:hypothetical protein
MKFTSVYPIAILLSLLVACEVAATDERRLKSFERELEPEPEPSPAPIGKSGKTTRGPAKAGKKSQGPAKAGKTGLTSNVPDPEDNSTGDSNGDIEIPLDASMSTSLRFPAGDIPGEFGKIDEIPLDASLSMSF